MTGTDDKHGENQSVQRDTELQTLRDAIKAGLDSGPSIPADEVFTELCARYADKS